jgi:hypothetical protein
MAGRRCLLTPETWKAIVEAIRAGAFDWVAAEAAGIGRRTFYDWLKRGESGDQRFVRFLADVRQARAEARAGAEWAVHKRDPLAWLRLGPGREREDEPGWTSPIKPGAATATEDSAQTVLDGALEEVPSPMSGELRSEAYEAKEA